MLRFICVSVPLLVQILNSVQAAKQYRLSVLAEVPFYENQAGDAQVCRVAMRLVADTANNRSDILQDYHVEIDFEDEDRNEGYQAVKQLFAYAARFENMKYHNDNEQLYKAPVMVAPRSSAGCQAYARVVDDLNMVGISYGCSSDFFTANRKIYSNLYRTRLPGELVPYSFLNLIRTVGNWTTIGLVSSMSTLDFSMAKVFAQLCRSRNIRLAWFDLLQSYDFTSIAAVKQSDARIIVVIINGGGDLLTFFCISYLLGMTGSRYVFLAMVSAFTDPSQYGTTVGKFCTRDMMLEQLRYTLWAGGLPFAIEQNYTSTLGHNTVSYDGTLRDITKGVAMADWTRRHQCYDAMLQTLVTLNQTENELNKQNRSLRDYGKDPVGIMKIANSTAGRIEYDGLRIGHVKYSQRLELDNEPQYVSSWSPEDASLKLLYNVKCQVGRSALDPDAYLVTKIRSIFWQTADGRPPKDIVSLYKDIEDITELGFGTVMTLSVLLTICQIVVFVPYVIKQRQGIGNVEGWAWMKAVVFSACILLNVASICFSAKYGPNSLATCNISFIAASFGLALEHGALFAEMRYLRNALTSAALCNKPLSSYFSNKSYHKRPLPFLLLFVLPIVFVVVIWFVIDPLNSLLLSASQYPVYDKDQDSYLLTLTNSCQSHYLMIWLLVIGGLLLLPLFAAAFLIYELRHGHHSGAIKQLASFKWTTLAVVNAMALLVGSMLIIVILQSTMSRYMAASYLLLLKSLLTGLYNFVPTFKGEVQEVKRSRSAIPSH